MVGILLGTMVVLFSPGSTLYHWMGSPAGIAWDGFEAGVEEDMGSMMKSVNRDAGG